MQASADDFSPWASTSCRGGLTLVEGTLQLSGLFIVQQYLRLLLQRDYAVVLVTAEQSFERYRQVAKKMGLSLPAYLQSGQLAHVAAPLAPLEGSDGQPKGGAPRLQQLLAAVGEAVRQRPAAAAGVALVVDSLTVTITRRRPPAGCSSSSGGGGGYEGGLLQAAGSRHSVFFRTTELAVSRRRRLCH
ncbi:hypothetical protein TSOC_003736 [Tetrabaena socialis]|uniref:Elongator complex protein 6 n=1 Tax=Tetrabaena socialis TaxID=47790 RepID=A0A2J8AAS2_9CHLO|nr:hypothetical protein TSOC_003736 [Tetrabaena socialis]|eukprot:PNH09626.1 hypothetical protein TSOC_003736 [Tetrabaena socialis]